MNESLSFGVSKESQNLMTESVISGVSGKMGACSRRKTECCVFAQGWDRPVTVACLKHGSAPQNVGTAGASQTKAPSSQVCAL